MSQNALTILVAFAALATAQGQDKPKIAAVEDPFPAVDCIVYDTGNKIADRHSEACRSFVQLVKAKDTQLPLTIGPVYACFGISDELFVIDTAMDQAKSDDKQLAASATPRVALYRSGIETGISLITTFMTGKWDLLLPTVVTYRGSTDSELAKAMHFPRFTLSIDEQQIAFDDLKIQFATGRFTYWTDIFGLSKNIQIPGQCAVFKRDWAMQAKVMHSSWKQTN